MMSVPQLLYIVISTYEWIIIAYVISSWLPQFQDHWIVQKLAALSDPYLNFFRAWIPLIAGSLDVSPIVALLVLSSVKHFLYMF